MHLPRHQFVERGDKQFHQFLSRPGEEVAIIFLSLLLARSLASSVHFCCLAQVSSRAPSEQSSCVHINQHDDNQRAETIQNIIIDNLLYSDEISRVDDN